MRLLLVVLTQAATEETTAGVCVLLRATEETSWLGMVVLASEEATRSLLSVLSTEPAKEATRRLLCVGLRLAKETASTSSGFLPKESSGSSVVVR